MRNPQHAQFRMDRSKTLSDIGMQPTDWQQELRLVIKRIAKRTEE